MDIDTLYIKPGIKSVINWDTLIISEYDLETDAFIQDVPVPESMLPLKEGRAIAVTEGEQAELLTAQRDAVVADLQNAIYVTQNSPYNTPEEQPIVNNTVALALADFRALTNPSEATLKLATDLLSWRIS